MGMAGRVAGGPSLTRGERTSAEVSAWFVKRDARIGETRPFPLGLSAALVEWRKFEQGTC